MTLHGHRTQFLYKGGTMKFSDYTIDEEDYKFFESLPEDEKILFIYDLICDNFYGNGSTGHTIEVDFETKLSTIIESTISEEADVNVLILNNKIILNSNIESNLNEYIIDLFMRGYIITHYVLDLEQTELFQKQKFCKVFKLLGIHQKINLN